VHLLRLLIRHFDGWLSRVEGVTPFTDDPQCLLRIQRGRAPADRFLPEAVVPAGSPVLYLHVWNERLPPIPGPGPDLLWARRTQRLVIASLKLMAQHLRQNPSLDDVRALGGVTAFLSLGRAKGGRALFEHLGFTVLPCYRPLGAFGEFWENFYTAWLIWTFNPASLRHRRFWDLQRTEFWMGREKFLARYG